MDILKMKQLSVKELKAAYREYLSGLGLGTATINTASVDAFYLLRKNGPDTFWNVVEADDFEKDAREALTKALAENTSGNAKQLINGYLSHLRRFRNFVFGNQTSITVLAKKEKPKQVKKKTVDVPKPSEEQVELYLARWDALEHYHLQEDALDKLFFDLVPTNTDISDILLKASALNDFYSTNIFSIYPVAKHILSLDIDARLAAGDETLISDIQHVEIGGVNKNFYSFSTKYCSHHNPLAFPIYDSYVDEVLRFFRDQDDFAEFRNEELKNYSRFKAVLIEFRTFYKLDRFNLKEIDKYLWQLGKEYFPKDYGKSK